MYIRDVASGLGWWCQLHVLKLKLFESSQLMPICKIIIIIIIIKGIYIAQVLKGYKCAMSAEMAVWLRNCLCLYSYLHN